MKKYLYILGVVLTGSSFAMAGPRPTTMPAPAPTIVKVVSRDSTLIVRSGPNGPMYAVQGKSGEVLVPAMTLSQLQAKHPGLARHVQTMNASAGGAWAGVE